MWTFESRSGENAMSTAVLLVCLSCPAVHHPKMHAEDAYRFPCYEACQSVWHFQSRYQNYLERVNCLGGKERQWTKEALSDLRYRQEVWGTAHYMSLPNACPEWRCTYLNKLRDLIGDENYALGRLPAPVNLEVFSRQ